MVFPNTGKYPTTMCLRKFPRKKNPNFKTVYFLIIKVKTLIRNHLDFLTSNYRGAKN